jgi:hypothetical protein
MVGGNMGRKYEQWRELDHRAFVIEARVRSSAKDHGSAGHTLDAERATELRADADKLFAEAMREINDEVRAAMSRRNPDLVRPEPHGPDR